MPKEKKAFSLVLVILITTSVLTGVWIVGDILIRHAKVIRASQISDKAYFAAETAVEKAAYDILKDYADVSAYTLAGDLSNGAAYLIDEAEDSDTYIHQDKECPDSTGTECTAGENLAGPWGGGNPWDVVLTPGQGLILDIDLEGADYPATLRLDQTAGSAGDSDLVITASNDGGSTWAESFSANFSTTTCVGGTIDSCYDLTIAADTYYKIRIANNSGAVSGAYRLQPTGVGETLPIGVIIRARGEDAHSSYYRRLQSNIPVWAKISQ